MEFIAVKGTDFAVNGTPIALKGMGIGSWLNIEHFMVGMPGAESIIRHTFTETFSRKQSNQFFEHFQEAFFDDEDCAFLASLGVNFIRVPFTYKLFIDDDTPGQLKPEGFAAFDRLFALCRKYGIYCMPDLHAVPGGQNPDWHSDNATGVPQFWQFRVFQDQMVHLWQEIARRYANEPAVMGWDLLNEPYLMGTTKQSLCRFYREATAAIRAVDTHHVILLEGDHFAMDFTGLGPIEDENTAITFHYYPTVWQPDIEAANVTREDRQAAFDRSFESIVSTMRDYHRPLLCGEAGYELRGHDVDEVMEWTADTIDLFDRHGISWALWSYKDAQFMGLVYPTSDSPWMQFADQIRRDWDHHREMTEGVGLVETMSQLFPGEVSGDLKYQLQFRQRSLMFVLQNEQILAPLLSDWGWDAIAHLPESFRFSRCQVHREFAKLISQGSKEEYIERK